MSMSAPSGSHSGPCRLCGATNYAASLSGPFVCPACDAGDTWFQSHPRAFRRMLGLAPAPVTNEREESNELFLAFVVGD